MVTRTQKAGALWRALPDRSYVTFSERRGQLVGPFPHIGNWGPPSPIFLSFPVISGSPTS